MKELKTTSELEQKLLAEGYKYIVGLDEAGRGPWAGPVTVGAFLFEADTVIVPGVTDSKAFSTELKRDALYTKLLTSGEKFITVSKSAREIDALGIAGAIHIAMSEAVSAIEQKYQIVEPYLLIDGANVREISGYEQMRINKGDLLHYSIAMASIAAKVERDRYMHILDSKYPGYGLASHKGYGTKAHKEALDKLGVSPEHRKSYKPIANLLDEVKK